MYFLFGWFFGSLWGFFLLTVLTSTFTELCKTSIVFLRFSHHCYILQDNLQYTHTHKKYFLCRLSLCF